jgi:transcriptional regulator with XRE-family HTH domain
MALRKYSSRTVGGNLKKIRQALNMSQEEFGKLAGDYSQDTVARWEAGQVPHALTLGLISKATNVTVDSILGHSKLITAKIVLKGKTKKNLQRVGKKETLSKKGGGGGGEGGGTVVLFPALSENGLDDTRRFESYRTVMGESGWNLSLRALYTSRSYEAGLTGANTLAELTEQFKERLAKHEYESNLIKLALLQLKCMDSLDLCGEYVDTWARWRRRPLYLHYQASKAADPKIVPFIAQRIRESMKVHFLYLTNGRKAVVQSKLGGTFHPHARQEDLTDTEIKARLSRIQPSGNGSY